MDEKSEGIRLQAPIDTDPHQVNDLLEIDYEGTDNSEFAERSASRVDHLYPDFDRELAEIEREWKREKLDESEYKRRVNSLLEKVGSRYTEDYIKEYESELTDTQNPNFEGVITELENLEFIHRGGMDWNNIDKNSVEMALEIGQILMEEY
jgi:hypothetical protein